MNTETKYYSLYGTSVICAYPGIVSFRRDGKRYSIYEEKVNVDGRSPSIALLPVEIMEFIVDLYDRTKWDELEIAEKECQKFLAYKRGKK